MAITSFSTLLYCLWRYLLPLIAACVRAGVQRQLDQRAAQGGRHDKPRAPRHRSARRGIAKCTAVVLSAPRICGKACRFCKHPPHSMMMTGGMTLLCWRAGQPCRRYSSQPEEFAYPVYGEDAATDGMTNVSLDEQS